MDVEIRGVIRRKRKIGAYIVKWWNLKWENAMKLSEKIKSEGKWKLEGDSSRIWRRWQIVSEGRVRRS